ncbi:unnamed protein product, partial [Closterium sp. NIES-53]
MVITIYFIATSLPDRLALVRDALLLKHPSELTIGVLESALKDVESNLYSVASASELGVAGGAAKVQAATEAMEVALRAVVAGVARVGGAPGAASSDSPTAAGGGAARVSRAPARLPATGARVAAWYLTQRQQQQGQQQGQQKRSRPCQLSRGDAHPPFPYIDQTGTCGGFRCDCRHPQGQCFAELTDTLRAAYVVDGPAPDWLPFVHSHSAALWAMSASQLFDLLGTPHAMYAIVESSASDSIYSRVFSLCAIVDSVPVASVGTFLGTSLGAAPEDASLSFPLDSGASHCFFRDHTTLTPLPAPVSVALADPTSGLVTARYTNTLPSPAVPSGFLTGFHVPSFS